MHPLMLASTPRKLSAHGLVSLLRLFLQGVYAHNCSLLASVVGFSLYSGVAMDDKLGGRRPGLDRHSIANAYRALRICDNGESAAWV